MFAEINWLAVVVAGAAFFAVGSAWYTFLFGKKWAQLVNLDWENPGGNMGLIFGLTFVLELLASTVLAILIRDSGFESWNGGLHVGLLAGVGVAFPVIAIGNLYQRRPGALTAIDAGHIALGLAVAGTILGAWR